MILIQLFEINQIINCRSVCINIDLDSSCWVVIGLVCSIYYRHVVVNKL